MESTAELKQLALSMGFQALGVAPPLPPPHFEQYREWIGKGFHGSMDYLEKHLPLKESPEHLLPGVRSVVVVSLNYYQNHVPEHLSPRIARYALGRDYHKVLRQKLNKLACWIEGRFPGAGTRVCVDSAPVMERDYAQLAGIGWFGKNTMLIDSRRGSWFFLGVLLTTVGFEEDRPAQGGCGNCTRCIDACPTGALVFSDNRWQLDARRCISYQTIEHKGALETATHGWTFGCDVCQEVCLFNQPRLSQPLRATVTREADFLRRRSWPSLEELAQIGDTEWDELTRGSALRRAGVEGLRRNATANLLENNEEGSSEPLGPCE